MTLATEAIAALTPVTSLTALQTPTTPQVASPHGASFAQLIGEGVERVNQKLISADSMVQAFATDDTVPVHQVTIALEEARLSLELMLQVRSRLMEGYQDIMRMQL